MANSQAFDSGELNVRRAEFEGPEGSDGVYAWMESWLPFDKLDDDWRRIRAELRSRLRRLSADPGQVLHATYSGRRHRLSDIENMLLYNVDDGGGCFQRCARNGIRFEFAPEALRRPPGGSELESAYAYRLRPIDGAFDHWRARRCVARFEEVPVASGTASLLSHTWLGLHRAKVALGDASVTEGAFSVRMTVRGPGSAAKPAVLKALIDGVVAALQGHDDPGSVPEVARRISSRLGVSDGEVESLLTRTDRAVLGVRERLVWPRGAGVQWNPGDDRCLAGEVIAGGSAPVWTLGGRVDAVEPA